MTKLKFLMALKDRLSDLPQDEVEERLGFYSEMIEDRIEEGLSEEEAVSAVGSVEEIAAQIIADILPAKVTKPQTKPKRRMKAWEVLLIILGSPIWFSLLIAVLAVAVSIYASLWAVVISLWAVFVSMACVFVCGVVYCALLALRGNYLAGFAMTGAVLVCAGLTVFLFFGCGAATKGMLLLTKKAVLRIWKGFAGRREA